MQALLIQTPQGNVLWDCLGFLHPDFVPEVERLGGIKVGGWAPPCCIRMRLPANALAAVARCA